MPQLTRQHHLNSPGAMVPLETANDFDDQAYFEPYSTLLSNTKDKTKVKMTKSSQIRPRVKFCRAG